MEQYAASFKGEAFMFDCRRKLMVVGFTITCSLVSRLAFAADPAAPIRVVVWDEQQPKQKQAYPRFLGNQIASYLESRSGLKVQSVRLDDPSQGLSDAILDECDVLIWWGHVRQDRISERKAQQIVARVKAGKLSLLPLHSAHWSMPFMVAMEERAKEDALGQLPEDQRSKTRVVFVDSRIRRAPQRDTPLTPSSEIRKQADGTFLLLMKRPNCCFPAYRPDGKPSTLHTLKVDHPIARGLPEKFTVPHTEMYDEPFHVPPPDEVVFEERWELGERFRSGAVWRIGKGKLFYFRPGHETFNVYFQPETLRVVENAVRWMATESRAVAKK